MGQLPINCLMDYTKISGVLLVLIVKSFH